MIDSCAGTPGVIVIVPDVAPVSNGELKYNVRSPIVPTMERPTKAAAPLAFVVAVTVPPSAPVPLAIAAVTTTPA